MTIKAYHISRYKDKKSIQEKGLLPVAKSMGRISYEPSIFVSTIELDVVAFWYVNCDYINCWEFLVEKDELIKDPFSPEETHFYITRPVPSGELKLIYEGE